MRYLSIVGLICNLAVMNGCSESSSPGQSTFYHNNREHQKWEANPSNKPSFRNPNTGHKLFY
jgi:hypothetical protein